ncbi:hypothetical protein H0H87_010630 [Tephrocybe sp. NHM501043]|nr:hypothetical protein H0H87_010630 [Tephrocybe sp. NHM501043]
MAITPDQNAAILEIINSILSATGKGKRQFAGMFLELVDRAGWPEYYELIPEPRCLNAIKSGVEKGRYKDATDVYTDLSLVFWNAMFYNEPTSQISQDAKTLKTLLETEWKNKSFLPATRSSPPPSSAQKVHKVVVEESSAASTSSSASTPAPAPVSAPPPVQAPPRVVTPAVRRTPIPTASSSTSHAKPVPIRPRSHLTPEMDVDIMSENGQGNEAPTAIYRDQESDEIVKQLEKGLPRWPGLGEEGWSEEVSQVSLCAMSFGSKLIRNAQERLSEILHAVKSYKDVM